MTIDICIPLAYPHKETYKMSGVILTMPADITPKEQRRWICRTVSDLQLQDVQDIYRFASTKIAKEMFITHSDGCRLNLDCVNDDVVLQIYNLVRSKIEDTCETKGGSVTESSAEGDTFPKPEAIS